MLYLLQLPTTDLAMLYHPHALPFTSYRCSTVLPASSSPAVKLIYLVDASVLGGWKREQNIGGKGVSWRTMMEKEGFRGCRTLLKEENIIEYIIITNNKPQLCPKYPWFLTWWWWWTQNIWQAALLHESYPWLCYHHFHWRNETEQICTNPPCTAFCIIVPIRHHCLIRSPMTAQGLSTEVLPVRFSCN